jgi:hypothetical protein
MRRRGPSAAHPAPAGGRGARGDGALAPGTVSGALSRRRQGARTREKWRCAMHRANRTAKRARARAHGGHPDLMEVWGAPPSPPVSQGRAPSTPPRAPGRLVGRNRPPWRRRGMARLRPRLRCRPTALTPRGGPCPEIGLPWSTCALVAATRAWNSQRRRSGEPRRPPALGGQGAGSKHKGGMGSQETGGGRPVRASAALHAAWRGGRPLMDGRARVPFWGSRVVGTLGQPRETQTAAGAGRRAPPRRETA